MITYFRVTNFKNLEDVEFRPRPVNAIIGPNGSGKSSLLQSLDFLRGFFRSSVEVYLQEKGWTYDDLPNLRQTRKIIRWELHADLPSAPDGLCGGRFELVISLSPRRHLAIGEEHLYYTPPGAERVTLVDRKGRRVSILNRKTQQVQKGSIFATPASIATAFDPVRHRELYPELFHFWQWIDRMRYFLIWDPKILRSRDRGRHEILGPSGEHLAPVLARLRKRNAGNFKKLVTRIQKLFPSVSDITVAGGSGWGWQTVRLHERGKRDIAYNSQQMSDGVLRLLSVTSLLYLEQIPTLAMFEEPENGVHPQLIRQVVQILRELALRKEPHPCQVMFTTHSPYVLDEFYDHPGEVFVMERARPQAGATLTCLAGKSDLAAVKEAFQGSLGEAWYSNLIGGTAGSRS